MLRRPIIWGPPRLVRQPNHSESTVPQILWPTVPSITGAKVVHVSLPGPFAGRNMISGIILQTYQQDVTDAVGALPVSY